MRRSEAMRLGALLRPQAFGDLFKGGGSCALGAVIEAIGITPAADRTDNDRVFQDWRAHPLVRAWSENPIYTPHRADYGLCPACGERQSKREPGSMLSAVIAHLNNDHRWTRERIADWVQSLEEAAEQLAASEPVAVGAQP